MTGSFSPLTLPSHHQPIGIPRSLLERVVNGYPMYRRTAMADGSPVNTEWYRETGLFFYRNGEGVWAITDDHADFEKNTGYMYSVKASPLPCDVAYKYYQGSTKKWINDPKIICVRD